MLKIGDRVRVTGGLYSGAEGKVTYIVSPDVIDIKLSDGSIVALYESQVKLTGTPADTELTLDQDTSPRAELLDEAKDLITGDRNATYGPPTQDFKRSADAMTALGYRKLSPTGETVDIESHDVAMLVAVVKMSRLMWSPGKKDSWVDLAGYSACGYECSVEEGYASG